MCVVWELVFILLLQEAIKTFFKINLSIKFTSQLSRLLKSMQFSIENHFLITLLRMHLESGGAMRDRTADLFAASEALSQLSYSPLKFYFFRRSSLKEKVVGDTGLEPVTPSL